MEQAVTLNWLRGIIFQWISGGANVRVIFRVGECPGKTSGELWADGLFGGFAEPNVRELSGNVLGKRQGDVRIPTQCYKSVRATHIQTSYPVRLAT